MPLFVKLDCEFDSDDKVLACSGQAQLVFIKSLMLSKRRMSDGFIHSKHLRLLADAFDDGPENRAGWAQELVDAGLWTEVPDGWVIGSWSKHNKSSADIEKDNAAEAERKRVWRESHRDKSGQFTRDEVSGRTFSDAESATHKGEGESEGEREPEAERKPGGVWGGSNNVTSLRALGKTTRRKVDVSDPYSYMAPDVAATHRAMHEGTA
jgi:hypothetical protein